MKFAPHQGEIAAQPTSLMKSRRLNRSKCTRFPLPGRRGLGEIKVRGALQREILTRLLTGLSHSRPMRSKPREHICPLLPESGQRADVLGRRFVPIAT